jgi:hypothetical protein
MRERTITVGVVSFTPGKVAYARTRGRMTAWAA